MVFYLYLFFSLSLCLILIVFDITFGLPIFTGAPFAVSSRAKMTKMMPLIKEAAVGRENLTVVDLGSGDGRIVAALAQNGFIARGLEINPFLVWYSRLKIKLAGLDKKALIKRANYWQEDFSQYDIVVLFGVFYIMAKLEKKLLTELKPGAVVICNHYRFPVWQPFRQEGDIYLYRMA